MEWCKPKYCQQDGLKCSVHRKIPLKSTIFIVFCKCFFIKIFHILFSISYLHSISCPASFILHIVSPQTLIIIKNMNPYSIIIYEAFLKLLLIHSKTSADQVLKNFTFEVLLCSRIKVRNSNQSACSAQGTTLVFRKLTARTVLMFKLI